MSATKKPRAAAQRGKIKPKPKVETEYRIRPYTGESGFVIGTWIQSYQASRFGRSHEPEDYLDFQSPVIVSLIKNGVVMLACDVNEPDTLYGHCVVTRSALGPVVHYVYVKNNYRCQGIGQALWTNALKQVGHREDSGGVVRYTHKGQGELWNGITGRRGWVHNQYLAHFYNPWDFAA